MSRPNPLEGFIQACLTSLHNLATVIQPKHHWPEIKDQLRQVEAARAELAALREDAQRWRRLRKRFFDKFGTPEAERWFTPIDDVVLHRFLFSAWEDAQKRKDDDNA